MKNINKALLVIFLCLLAVKPLYTQDSTLFKIDKAYNLFSAVFKNILNRYVIQIDPEILVNEGIKGMINSLDPYTVLYDDTNDTEFETLVQGSYVGFGITVNTIDSMITILDVVDGFPAKKNGLRIGDIIYKIDSNKVINLNSNELRQYTSGKVGSKSSVTIIRNEFKDTLTYDIIREDIKIKSVGSYYLINDTTGYIKLESFSKNSYEEFKKSFIELKRNTKLRSLIIDLRNNTGGYLDASVRICELFVPIGTKVVSTKGTNNNYDYNTTLNPIDTIIKLAVLINNNSASASEVLSGALQDLDRAIIVGETSFGKGLVQSIFDLPYKKSIKITTAKYFTPSGRCIQRIDYMKEKNKVKNTPNIDSVFYTMNGRIVKEENGITPDITVKDSFELEKYSAILSSNIVFNFANVKSNKLSNDKILQNDYFQEFLDFYEKSLKNKTNNLNSKNPIHKTIININSLLADKSIESKTIEDLKMVKDELIKNDINIIKKNKEIISSKLKEEILYRTLDYQEYIKFKNSSDIAIKIALENLDDRKYTYILQKK